ncbi:hypothetical protein GIB67_006113 [Kingdonia uniflora]|uniref:CST complex subunit STN1 n=1 Tax=Kingdonia uniflora TaxID=39325 RepID=A0A7J7LPM9_9MAGN|nr:hypothetical protein GIB67_006113 [Kingdonia uniflora]
MDPMQTSHVKLLAFDFLSLTQTPTSDPNLFFRKNRPVSRVETLGIVVSRDLIPDKFLRFVIDDGTGCIPCIIWLNHFNSPYFARKNPSDVRVMADIANNQAMQIQLGVLARVRGKVTVFRGVLQITVLDAVVERDPNMEILHWLDCVKLARQCYNVKLKPAVATKSVVGEGSSSSVMR